MPPITRRALLRLSVASLASASMLAFAGSVLAQSLTPDASVPGPIAAAAPEWQLRWDDLVAAAKREGSLRLVTVAGRGYSAAIRVFEQTFPGIAVDHIAQSTPSVWLRQARATPFDVGMVSPRVPFAEGAGLWTPLKPLLFRPDVVHDAAWRGGFNSRFLDSAGEGCFGWEYQVIHAYAVNTDMVQPAEIASVGDLLSPRWRGAVVSSDPRLGTALFSSAAVARHRGYDALHQLLVDQRPTFRDTANNRILESLVRGERPIAVGVRPKALNPLREQGRGWNVAYLDEPDADFAASNGLLVFTEAPHPAAAGLFANWY